MKRLHDYVDDLTEQGTVGTQPPQPTGNRPAAAPPTRPKTDAELRREREQLRRDDEVKLAPENEGEDEPEGEYQFLSRSGQNAILQDKKTRQRITVPLDRLNLLRKAGEAQHESAALDRLLLLAGVVRMDEIKEPDLEQGEEEDRQ